jgi:LmbE family N-acetylglucosaminyl deacetylase
MRHQLPLFALAVLVASNAHPAQRRSPPTFPGASSLLWVGAHPDDEVIAAPLLGRLCVEEGLACAFLVMTRGEAGQCRLASGCHPDLGSVRAAEMRRSARLFGAQLTQWGLPDGAGATGWAAASGSLETLLGQISALVQATNPDIVLTFDPRHGSTCHPDHRAAADLVVQAVSRGPRRPTVYLLETVVTGSTLPFNISYAAGTGPVHGTLGFDANQSLPSVGQAAWQFTVFAAQAHPSQFVPSAVRGLSRFSTRQRVVYTAPAALALGTPPALGCS